MTTKEINYQIKDADPKEINYQIRDAHPSDASDLVTLVSKGMIGYPFEAVYNEHAVRSSLEKPSDRRIVAVENHTNELIGTAVLGNDGDHMQEIKRVVVDPDARKNGVATAMTVHLARLAQDLKVVSWADARGCQPGMQSASLHAGHRAISLETGKHCVYWHLDQNDRLPVGPARETMVHFTSLPVDIKKLQKHLQKWPDSLSGELLTSLSQSLSPAEKNQDIVKEMLPSAVEVKKRIFRNLRCAVASNKIKITENPDVVLVNQGDANIVVILPDASGFIVSSPNADLGRVVQLGQKIGLQTVTTYVDVDDLAALPILQGAGLKPTMLRVWQEKGGKPTWQVGWRSVANNFGQSLHYLRLHEKTVEQVSEIISRIS